MRLITILLGIAIYQFSGPYVKPAEQEDRWENKVSLSSSILGMQQDVRLAISLE
ncbi:MAG: hypothetical protein ACM31J_03665 [Nitrososphaerales archaeon]